MSSKEIIKAIETSDGGAFDALVGKDKSATLEAASLKSLQVGGIRIHSVDCANTEWEACLFDGTVFDGVDLQGAYFNGCTFHDCEFCNAVLAEVSFDGCVWQKSAVRDAEDLEAAEFTNCQFKACDLENLHFLDTVLDSLTITDGAMRHIGGIAELKSVVLRNVSIDGFDTSEMSLTACTSSGCTQVPSGFATCEGRRRRV